MIQMNWIFSTESSKKRLRPGFEPSARTVNALPMERLGLTTGRPGLFCWACLQGRLDAVAVRSLLTVFKFYLFLFLFSVFASVNIQTSEPDVYGSLSQVTPCLSRQFHGVLFRQCHFSLVACSFWSVHAPLGVSQWPWHPIGLRSQKVGSFAFGKRKFSF